MSPTSDDEVLEGRVLSDDEVSRMEIMERVTEKMEANYTRAIIEHQDTINRERLMRFYEYSSALNKQSSFFKDI